MSAAIYWIHGRTNRLGPSFAQVSRCLGHSPLCRPQKINASRASTLACSGYWKHYLLQPLPHLSRTQSYSNKPTNVFTMNASINMLRKRISFSGTPGGIGTSSQNQSVVPIGIIPTKNNKGHNLNIVVVPMDLSNMTYNDFKHMMQSLNVLRSCADQVESLTAEMLEHNEATDEKSTAPIVEELEETNEQPFWETAATTDKIDAVGKSTQIVVPNELQQAAAIAQASLGSSSEWSPLPSDLPPAPRVSPAAMSSTAPQTQPDLPLPEYNETPPPTYAATQQNLLQLEQDECTDKPVSIELPKNLETRLKELAISSMQLSFEMDMSNIKNALTPKAGNAKNSLLMETEVNMQEDKVPAKTIPLAFNALIQGTVEVDASKMYVDNLAPEDVSDFNDNVTAIAANICSTALEQGFPSELSTNMDMTLRQNPTVASKTNEHVKCIATKEKGCISPGNAHLPFYDPKEQQEDADSKSKACSSRITAQARMALKRRQIQKHMKCEQTKPKQLDTENDFSTMRPALNDNGCKHRVIKKKKKCPKKCPLDDPCEEKEKPCIEKKQPKKKAASTTEITASKKGDAKKDAAGKGGEDKGGKAGGDKKKEDPCAKFKKGGKGDGGKDGGGKGKGGKDGGKGDGGKDGKGKGGKDGGDKKNDPCAKFKKGGKGDGGKDGKGKGGKEGGDKKNDPCAKFKKGGKADGGKDGKGKGGKDGGGKKEDPCAKFKKGGKGEGGKDGKDKDGKDGGDKKKDPCAKFKKGGKGDGGKDGKGKGGKDGGDKKKDPCAKFKKGGKGDGGKDGKGKGGKDGGDKKEDPYAKLKKGGGKGDGGKDGKGKGGKEGGDKKKKDPCAKFKKGGKRDGGKDGKGGKNGADKKKKDPCAKFKKGGKSGKDGGKGKGGKDANRKGGKDGGKTDPCKKKFSTFGRPSFLVYSTKVRRHYSALPVKSHRSKLVEPMTPTQQTGPRFLIYSTLIRRHYAKKADKSGGKCSAMAPKYPKNRKNQKERTGLRTDCFKDEKGEGCPKPLRSKKPKCDKVKVRRPKCDRSKNKKKSKRSKKFKKSKQSKRPTDKEGNKLLSVISPMVSQIRGMRHSAKKPKRYISQAKAHESVVSCQNEQEEHLQLQQRQPAEEKPIKTLNHAEVIRIKDAYKIYSENIPIPYLKSYDVLIRTGSVAISGSDIHIFENGNRDVEGMSLGHDATGFIEQIGPCVQNLRVGDRVVVESAVSCGTCDFCKQGLYNMCVELNYAGFLATHQAHPADLCHRLPDSISMEEGALTQTLALGCQACFKAQITPTSNVLIIGSGPTAVTAAMCSAAVGAKQVVIAGTMSSTLDTIKRDFGFNVVHFDSSALFGEVLEAIFSKLGGWPHCAINCSISAMTMNLAVMALQPCGLCVLSECDSECASFNALDILMKNIRLVPSFRSVNMFPTALQLMKSKRAPMCKFISKSYSWTEMLNALKRAQHESNVGLRKIIVNFAEEGNIG